jgi:hypothetical protein
MPFCSFASVFITNFEARANFSPVMSIRSHQVVLILVAMLLIWIDVAHAQGTPGRRRLNFSGVVDADFASHYGTFDKVQHYTGLEVDLTTSLTFSPVLSAQVRTTMRDGNVPRHGDGNTWAPLQYDGAQVNWKPGEKIHVMAGDLVAGSGYFQYARYKQIASVVGEHSLRGAGMRHGNIIVHTGVATDSAGEMGDWSVYAEWTRTINPTMSWSPSFRYTAGIHKAYPFELGVSFNGNFDDVLLLSTHMAMNYWNTATDPGSLILIEPRYIYGEFFVAATLLHSDKGEVPAPNGPRFTQSWQGVEDFLFSVEPGMALSNLYTAAVALEYRNPSVNRAYDESFWLIPSLYIYPAPGAEWRVWTGLEKPLARGSAGHPRLALGSEISFKF